MRVLLLPVVFFVACLGSGRAQTYILFTGLEQHSGDRSAAALSSTSANWISVRSVDQDGLSAAVSGAATPSGRRNYEPVRITKRIDKASPKLQELCAEGSHISTLYILLPAVQKARATARPGGADVGKNAADYLRYELQDVVISSYLTSGNGPQTVETLTLNYAKISAQPADPSQVRSVQYRESDLDFVAK